MNRSASFCSMSTARTEGISRRVQTDASSALSKKPVDTSLFLFSLSACACLFVCISLRVYVHRRRPQAFFAFGRARIVERALEVSFLHHLHAALPLLHPDVSGTESRRSRPRSFLFNLCVAVQNEDKPFQGAFHWTLSRVRSGESSRANAQSDPQHNRNNEMRDFRAATHLLVYYQWGERADVP